MKNKFLLLFYSLSNLLKLFALSVCLFISKNLISKVVMIACISPGSSSADHSINTLRYA